LFNHESPHRGETFVTRKITRAVGRISVGIQNKLTLGNLDSERDWGFAGDYVEAMWKILNHSNPDDFVISTGESHTVKEFLKIAFESVNLEYSDYVEVSQKYFRPNEVKYLLGDSSKAKKELNWKPNTSFQDLVKMMIEHDIRIAQSEKILLDEGLLEPSWEN
jgi:GDPmannose 4,6-dehydratase